MTTTATTAAAPASPTLADLLAPYSSATMPLPKPTRPTLADRLQYA